MRAQRLLRSSSHEAPVTWGKFAAILAPRQRFPATLPERVGYADGRDLRARTPTAAVWPVSRRCSHGSGWPQRTFNLQIRRAWGRCPLDTALFLGEENGSNVRCVLPDPPQSALFGVKIGVNSIPLPSVPIWSTTAAWFAPLCGLGTAATRS